MQQGKSKRVKRQAKEERRRERRARSRAGREPPARAAERVTAVSAAQLARYLGCSEERASAITSELVSMGVVHREEGEPAAV